MIKYKISFAGAGKVAGSLCRKLYSEGFIIDLVSSPTNKSGLVLADLCNSKWSSQLMFPDSTNLIIVAVPDRQLKSVLQSVRCHPDCIVVHTAGSFGTDIFPAGIRNKGVFYPLQTFSEGRDIDYTELPILLEASDDNVYEVLEKIALSLDAKVYRVDNESRRLLHVAAVFSCNFSNHLLTLGKDIAYKAGFNFEILKPLIIETLSKAMEKGPDNSQTGPAIRHDQNTIEKHLEMLSFSPELQQIYSEMTHSIIDYYKES